MSVFRDEFCCLKWGGFMNQEVIPTMFRIPFHGTTPVFTGKCLARPRTREPALCWCVALGAGAWQYHRIARPHRFQVCILIQVPGSRLRRLASLRIDADM